MTCGCLGQNGITYACLDLLDLLNRSSLVKSIDEEINVAGGSQLLVVVFSVYRLVLSSKPLPPIAQLSITTHLRVLFEWLCFFGTGKSEVTTLLPAATTLLQSRSTRDDSEKMLKFCLKPSIDLTTAGAPSGFLSSFLSGKMYFWFSTSSSRLLARILGFPHAQCRSELRSQDELAKVHGHNAEQSPLGACPQSPCKVEGDQGWVYPHSSLGRE